MTFSRRSLPALVLSALVGATLGLSPAIAAQPVPGDAFIRAPQKPNGSGVDVRYRVEGKPAIGKPTRVEIVLRGVTDPNGALVRLTADAALRVDNSAAPMNVPAGPVNSLDVTVIPQGEGLAYLNVFVSQGGATSSISIPIQTGAVNTGASNKSAPGRLKDLPTGDKILSMPVK
jgi:hypothetical protein